MRFSVMYSKFRVSTWLKIRFFTISFWPLIKNRLNLWKFVGLRNSIKTFSVFVPFKIWTWRRQFLYSQLSSYFDILRSSSIRFLDFSRSKFELAFLRNCKEKFIFTLKMSFENVNDQKSYVLAATTITAPINTRITFCYYLYPFYKDLRPQFPV